MALITEKGIITFKSEVDTGISKNGNSWSRQTIVVSREGIIAPYDKVALSVFGDKVVDSERCKVGDKVEITYSISAKEYNGRWYNDVSLYRIDLQEASTRAAQRPAQAGEPFPANCFEEQKGYLPF